MEKKTFFDAPKTVNTLEEKKNKCIKLFSFSLTAA